MGAGTITAAAVTVAESITVGSEDVGSLVEGAYSEICATGEVAAVTASSYTFYSVEGTVHDGRRCSGDAACVVDAGEGYHSYYLS